MEVMIRDKVHPVTPESILPANKFDSNGLLRAAPSRIPLKDIGNSKSILASGPKRIPIYHATPEVVERVVKGNERGRYMQPTQSFK
jgi:hypothetical protein